MKVSIFLNLLDGVTGPIRRVTQAVTAAGKAMESVTEKTDKIFKRAADIRHTADGFSRFAATGRAAVISVTDAFEPFEAAMARVRANTKPTSDEFKKMNELARQIGTQGRFSAIEAAKGMDDLRTQGFSAAEILRALPIAIDASTASGVSLAEMIDASTGVMGAFGLGASEMARVVDVVSNAASASGSPVGAMNEALAGTGRAAVDAGLSIERVAAMAGLLATQEIEGGQASATLEKVLRTLIHPTKDAEKFFAKLGVTTSETVDGVKKLRDPLVVLTEIQESMNRIGVNSNDQLSNWQVLLGGSANEVTALIRAANGPGLEQLTTAIEGATGATADLAKEINVGGLDATNGLNGALEELRITLGESLDPVLRDIKKILAETIENVTKWMKENPGLTKALALTAVAGVAAASAMAALLSVVASMVAGKAIFMLAQGYGVFSTTIGATLLKAIGQSVVGLGGLASATWAAIAPALVAAAPFIAVGAAIAAVAIAVDQLAEAWGKLDMGEVWEGMKAMSIPEALDTLFDPTTILKELPKQNGLLAFATGNMSLGPAVASGSPSAAIAGAGEAPRGAIEVNITSEGRPVVKSVSARGGIELEATAGMMMSGG